MNEELKDKVEIEVVEPTDAELEALIDEVKEEPYEAPKKPSFLKSITKSFHRKRRNEHHALRSRFQQLAGITATPAARVTIRGQSFDLQELPPWYDVVRFKLCGIKYEVIYPF